MILPVPDRVIRDDTKFSDIRLRKMNGTQTEKEKWGSDHTKDELDRFKLVIDFQITYSMPDRHFFSSTVIATNVIMSYRIHALRKVNFTNSSIFFLFEFKFHVRRSTQSLYFISYFISVMDPYRLFNERAQFSLPDGSLRIFLIHFAMNAHLSSQYMLMEDYDNWIF